MSVPLFSCNFNCRIVQKSLPGKFLCVAYGWYGTRTEKQILLGTNYRRCFCSGFLPNWQKDGQSMWSVYHTSVLMPSQPIATGSLLHLPPVIYSSSTNTSKAHWMNPIFPRINQATVQWKSLLIHFKINNIKIREMLWCLSLRCLRYAFCNFVWYLLWFWLCLLGFYVMHFVVSCYKTYEAYMESHMT